MHQNCLGVSSLLLFHPTSANEVMIFKILLLKLTLVPVAKPELICELSDCSLPGAKPAHENCTEDHFISLNLMPIVRINSTSTAGSLLQVAGSVPDPNCITLTLQFTTQKDPAKDRKFHIGSICHNPEFFHYGLGFEMLRVGSSRRLKCFVPFFNETEQCRTMRNDLLRIRADGRGIEMENFNRNGDQIIGRMKFLKRNHSVDLFGNCDCKEFGKLNHRYILCKDDSEILIKKHAAYSIAAGFVIICVMSVIYFLLVKE